MRRIVLFAWLAVAPVLAVAPALARADAPTPDPTARRHVGFFLRMDLGVGYLGSSAVAGGVETSVVGLSIPFGIAIGGAVTENLILAGDLWGVSGFSPTYSVGGTPTTVGASGFGMGGLGVNVTWYLMPANVYLSATPSLGGVRWTRGGETSSGRLGFGLKTGVGKEWWLGDHWGLGVAAWLLLGVNSGNGADPPTWTTVGGSLAVSATYN